MFFVVSSLNIAFILQKMFADCLWLFFFFHKKIAIIGLTIEEEITYAQNKHILVGITVEFPFQLKSVSLTENLFHP